MPAVHWRFSFVHGLNGEKRLAGLRMKVLLPMQALEKGEPKT